ncbi:MAG: hypothetical protein ACJ8IK_21455 [Burkholderiaceae bacterium]
MPASLHLFDLERHASPLPETFAELEAMRQSHRARLDRKNLRFVEFALRFEERIQAVRNGRAAPLQQANACRRAAWRFELPEVDAPAAYRAAVEIAAALGLVAYDATLGRAFLPDGRVVPAQFPAVPAAAPHTDRLRGEHEVRAVLAPALAGAMAASGFAPVPAATPADPVVLVRQLGPVRQALTVQLRRNERLEMSWRVWHEACTAVFERVDGPASGAVAAFELPLDFFEPGPVPTHRWQLERLDELPGVLALVRDRVLPLAELTQDLHGLDQVLNDASAESVRTPYRDAYGWLGRPAGSDGSRSLRDISATRVQRLVIAHLNGNPATGDIDRWLDASTPPADDAAASSARATLDAVRAVLASTPPLAAWPDAQGWRAALRPIAASLQACRPDPRGRRCHHWEVTEALRQGLAKDRAAFWNLFAGPDGGAELQRLWHAKALTLPAEARVASDGLACRVRTLPGRAGAGDIHVAWLEFPPIQGVHEERVLALARRGDAWRMYRMGYDHALHEGRMRLRIEYWVGHASGSGHLVRRETLPREWSVDEFLQRVRETFD